MAKAKTIFFCSSCGASSPKWLGKCPHCGEWNTYQEEIIQKETVAEEKRRSWAGDNGKQDMVKAVPLQHIQSGTTLRLPTPDGKLMHAMLRIGDSALMLVDAFPQMGALDPKALKGSPVTIHLYVNDVDATMAQAQRAGATLTMPAQDMFWGDRYGQLRDPFGHHWSVATHVQDLTPEQIQANLARMAPNAECGGG